MSRQGSISAMDGGWGGSILDGERKLFRGYSSVIFGHIFYRTIVQVPSSERSSDHLLRVGVDGFVSILKFQVNVLLPVRLFRSIPVVAYRSTVHRN